MGGNHQQTTLPFFAGLLIFGAPRDSAKCYEFLSFFGGQNAGNPSGHPEKTICDFHITIFTEAL